MGLFVLLNALICEHKSSPPIIKNTIRGRIQALMCKSVQREAIVCSVGTV